MLCVLGRRREVERGGWREEGGGRREEGGGRREEGERREGKKEVNFEPIILDVVH